MSIVNSTFSGNRATTGGGALDLRSLEELLISHSTITNNVVSNGNSTTGGGGLLTDAVAGLWLMTHTIVAGNSDQSGVAPDIAMADGMDVRFSLIGDHTGSNFVDVDGNILGTAAAPVDPHLGPLADNGGPTTTHALLPGSPAVDAGDARLQAGVDAPSFDQRGPLFDRVRDGDGDTVASIDMGAFELPPSAGGPTGDFDGDGDFDGHDIDALVAEIALARHDPAFDLTRDGRVDLADRDTWLSWAGEVNLGTGRSYLLGDANLDGVVDGSDFGRWNGNKFTSMAAWTAGDFNADGIVDGSDFGIWNGGKFMSADEGAGRWLTEPRKGCRRTAR